jgi:hypothetical protein
METYEVERLMDIQEYRAWREGPLHDDYEGML